jgi:hypothetical protein
MVTARCRTCHAPVEWAQTLKARKWIPLDPGLAEDGNLEIAHRASNGTPIVRLVPLAERDGLELRRTHYATCPNADAHRRPR